MAEPPKDPPAAPPKETPPPGPQLQLSTKTPSDRFLQLAAQVAFAVRQSIESVDHAKELREEMALLRATLSKTLTTKERILSFAKLLGVGLLGAVIAYREAHGGATDVLKQVLDLLTGSATP